MKSVGEAKAFKSAASALPEVFLDIGLTSMLVKKSAHLKAANMFHAETMISMAPVMAFPHNLFKLAH